MTSNRFAVPVSSLDDVRVERSQQQQVQPASAPHSATADLPGPADAGTDADGD